MPGDGDCKMGESVNRWTGLKAVAYHLANWVNSGCSTMPSPKSEAVGIEKDILNARFNEHSGYSSF